jgi:hypothetical protein
MAANRITKRTVDALKTRSAEYTRWDESLPGFGALA